MAPQSPQYRQLILGEFRPEPPKQYDCNNCQNRQGLQTSGDNVAVKCLGRWRPVPKDGCPAYSDGKDLEAMDRCAPPAGFRAKKWGGL